MRELTALQVAVGLLHLPSRARTLRDVVLPPDLDLLLRIVANDDQALTDAIGKTELTRSAVQAAASFYIEQILLHPGADSYRTLGAGPDATIDELRRNMALLLRWLHPDREVNKSRAVYAGRVTDAWNNIKTADRRAVYDESRKKAANGKLAVRSSHENYITFPTGDVPAIRRRRPRKQGAANIWRYVRRLFCRPRP